MDLSVSILIGVLVLLFFLAAFIILKTMLFSPRQKKVKPRELVQIDGESVAERLGLAVQYKTIAYPEPEKMDGGAFTGLHRLLQTLYPQVHTSLKREVINDYSLLYTWEGTNPDLQPIMLIAHMDVVPADESATSGWSHPPFSGERSDGYVWGRGTLDIKSSVIGIMEAVEYLLKQGFQPERTVYIGFGHDEEIGGANGAVAIAQLLQTRGVQLGSLLDEGGSVIEGFLPDVETPVAVIGISEKGYLSLKLTVEVDGGHSSMPPQETAIGLLSLAIARLQASPMPARLEVVEFLMGYIGSALPFKQRMAFANTWLFRNRLINELSESKTLNAMIRTTTAPTIFQAGMNDNVLPGKAEAVVNFRILPGDDLRLVYETVLEIIADERVKVTPFQGDTLEGESGWNPSPVADTDSAYFYRLTRLAREAFPGALAAPYLVLGGTDARHYAEVTDNALRFTPILMTTEDLQRMHGVNERLSFEECSRMVGFYIAYIEEMSQLPAEVDIVKEPEPLEEPLPFEDDFLEEMPQGEPADQASEPESEPESEAEAPADEGEAADKA